MAGSPASPEPSTLNPDPDRLGEEQPAKQRPIAPRETFGAVVALPILSNATTWPLFERGSGHPRRHRDASFLPPASAAIYGATIDLHQEARIGTTGARAVQQMADLTGGPADAPGMP